MKDRDKFQSYQEYLGRKGLKSTRQRDLIVRHFFSKHRHINADELWAEVKQADPKVGYATVYRTLKLLSECGLAHKREFGAGHALYEHVTDHHHDHLICLGCHKIVEFENDQIEELQEKVCRKHGFRLTHHKMELYGYCERCSKKEGH